jgi:hypothetical protein
VLAFKPSVSNAAANTALSPSWRYLVQRWAELLDDHAPLSRSAYSYVDPVTAVRESVEAATEFLGSTEFRYPTMVEAFQTLRRLITAEPNLHAWFPAERSAALAALKRVQPVRGADPVAKRRHVVRRTRGALQNELLSLQRALDDPVQGYARRLLDAVARAEPTTDAEWRAFDEDLAYLAAYALGEGRGARHLVVTVAEGLARSRTDQEAEDVFRSVVTSPRERHTVVVILLGARGVHRDATRFGCELVGKPPTWPNGNRGKNGQRLQDFLRRHSTGSACALFVPVDAFDYEHAWRVALTHADRLLDQLAAEHRVAEFKFKDDGLVLRESDQKLRTLAPPRAQVVVARPLAKQSIPELERSMRFHRLARATDAPVLAVAQSWIALEHLARNAQKRVTHDRAGNPLRGGPVWRDENPAVFLPAHVAATAFLAAGRNAIVSSWNIARLGGNTATQGRWRELERWLGVGANPWLVDPDRWLRLLRTTPDETPPTQLDPTASVAEAAAVLWDMVALMTPFVQQRVADTARLVRRLGALVYFASQVEGRARTNVSRVQLMRHRTVHGALMDSESAFQLASAAHHVIDAVYEVLPNWLQANQPTWRSFFAARQWSEQLKREWNRPAAQLSRPTHSIVRGP